MVAVIAGLMIAEGFLKDVPTFSALLLGDIAGDAFYYLVGKYGGRPIMGWSKGLIKKMEGHLIGLENHFKNHGAKTLIFGKTQAYGAAILMGAGAAKMPFIRFFWVSTLGSCVKIPLLILIGYFFGKSYREINNIFYVGALVSLVLLVIILSVWMRRKTLKP